MWDEWTQMPSQPPGFPKLNASFVKNTRKVGRHGDGNGLYLVVDPSGARRWIVRTVIRGRRRDAGLGSARLVSLSEARIKAVELRGAAREGRDPIFERRKQTVKVPGFREAAEKLYVERRASFRSDKHATQWISTLRTYAYPAIGDVPVDKVTPSDIHRVLQPIWHSKPETAKRLKQRLSRYSSGPRRMASCPARTSRSRLTGYWLRKGGSPRSTGRFPTIRSATSSSNSNAAQPPRQ